MADEQRDRTASDWRLERYLLGEAPADELQETRETLARDEGLRARLEELERSNAELLARHPPRAMAAAIDARARREPETGPRPGFVIATALAASVAVFAAVGPLGRDPGRSDDVTRIKGLAPHLLLYRQNGAAGAEPLAPGTTARANDVVQIAYQAAGHRYGVIISIDGRGTVTRHLPAAGPDAAILAPGPAALPQAFRLDDAPRFERFYLVTAAQPFPVTTVEGAIRKRAGDRLDLPPSLAQSSFLLKKETAR
jgi:hypothetical protein